MKRFDAKLAAPRPLRRLLDRRLEAVHVIAAVAVVAEQELVVVLGGAAEGAALALDALPRVLAHGDQHVVGELETRRVA
jgi:selenocysteine lyase/cysteine desulfurase